MSAKWKRWGLELVIVLAGFLILRSYQTRSHLRGPAPGFSARDLDGKPIAIGGPADAPIMLHFWATWCGVCRAEEGSIIAVSERVRVISVASRSGPSEAVARYVHDNQLPYPVINDPTGSLALRYGVKAYPTTYFLGRDGVIATSEVGYTTYLGLLLRALWAGI